MVVFQVAYHKCKFAIETNTYHKSSIKYIGEQITFNWYAINCKTRQMKFCP